MRRSRTDRQRNHPALAAWFAIAVALPASAGLAVEPDGEAIYRTHCARCHGLDAISGGIAPDLRYLETGDSGDEWFVQRYQHGSSRDGKVYMPPFGEVLGQKAGWAIRTWIESKHTDE